MTEVPQTTVARRLVFYIPGFDPNPPRRYRELYRTEGAAQAEISGYGIRVRTDGLPPNSWQVDSNIDGHTASARFEVLVWSDLVKASMGASIPATYWQLIRVVSTYTVSGALRRLMWLRKGPILAAFYPVVVLVLQLLIGVLLGATVAGLGVAGVLGALQLIGVSDKSAFATWTTLILWWAITLALIWVVLEWFRARDGKLFAWYLMHDFAYAAGRRGAYPADLEERLEVFAARIAEAMAEDVDEVLVVGHSSGAQLAVSVLADLIRSGRVPATGPALSLLTLGQAIPMVSFLPKAARLRRDLHDLAQCDALTWVDVSAPGDGCSFALCDPVAVSGVALDDQRWPLVLSAAFSQTLSKAKRRALRWRYFRLHFQYLCAFDQPGGYDYFQITAGPLTLADRFAGRSPSSNRIDVPASRYTDMAV
ncbi:MAG: hypothetical protein AAFQ79_12200 [Pseudomonadota bacterium]